MAGINDYSNTAGSNTTINGIDIAEGCSPAGINNAIRQLMADIADMDDGVVPLQTPDINGGTIDGAVIGGTTPAAGTFTNLTATGTLTGLLGNVVEDATPQLGGDLDLNSNDITGTGNINITGTATVNGEVSISEKISHIGDTNTFLQFNGNDTFSITTAGTERMRFQSGGSVGIGESTPVGILTVNGGTNTNVFFQTTGSGNTATDGMVVGNVGGDSSSYQFYNYENGYMRFATNGSERMRITSTGSVYFGQTTDDSPGNGDTNTGASINPEGSAYFSRSRPTANAGMIVNINRNTTDGDLIDFNKDGTTVGSIGSREGRMYIHSPSPTGSGIRMGDAFIMPCDSDGTDSDNDTDLGQANSRWQDLYLSGNIYLGGTTSANALDDYEEGTFTPVFDGDSGSFSSVTYDSFRAGRYTKIGRLVFAYGFIRTDAISLGTLSGTLKIDGLPFTVLSTGQPYRFTVALGTRHNFNGAIEIVGASVNDNSTHFFLTKDYNTGSSVQVTDLGTGTNQNHLQFTAIYETA